MKTNEQLAQLAEETGKIKAAFYLGERIEGSDNGISWEETTNREFWKFLRRQKSPKDLEAERILANNAKVKEEWEKGGKVRRLECRSSLKGPHTWWGAIGDNFDNPAFEYRLTPLPIYVPWTMDTHPMEPIFVRIKGDKTTLSLIPRWEESGPTTTYIGRVTFQALLADFEHVHADRSVHPCGTLKEGAE